MDRVVEHGEGPSFRRDGDRVLVYTTRNPRKRLRWGVLVLTTGLPRLVDASWFETKEAAEKFAAAAARAALAEGYEEMVA